LSIPITRSSFLGDSGILPLAPNASSEKRGFHSKLATFGGGHIHVPDLERW
jgi:hypothetical protein